jgi:hypothetical protein
MANRLVLHKVSFVNPVDVPTLGVVGSVNLGQGEAQALVKDDPVNRCVIVTSKDPRVSNRRVRVPYENVRSLLEVYEEVVDVGPIANIRDEELAKPAQKAGVPSAKK